MMAARSRFTSASISFQSCSFMSHLFLIFNALQIALFEQPHRSCIIALLLLTCIIDSAYSTVTTYEAMQAIADEDTSKAGNAQAQVVRPEEIKHVSPLTFPSLSANYALALVHLRYTQQFLQ